MNAAANPPVWDMIETLTKSRLVVPPLGATDPSQINTFGEWHWGTRELETMAELYLFDVEAVARNIIDHGPVFALSHGGHGINSYALTLLTTAPSGDVAFFTQHGLGGAYSDEDRDIARINDTYQLVAREWADLDDGTRSNRVRSLVFSSDLRGETGIVDLGALRGGRGESAIDRIDHNSLFEELKARRARRAAAVAPPASLLGIVPHLAEMLRRLEDDSHLVIGIHGSIRYVQFATFRPNLRLETIGSRYLEEGGEVMPVDELVWLADRGWHDADDGGNLWQEWIPADEDAAAAAAVAALVDVHGVTDVEQVWFYSEDDNALAALDGYSPPAPTRDLQETARARAAEINAALMADRLRLPSGSKVVAVVDYIARTAVLEVLGFGGDEVFRRHDGGWRKDPEWRKVLPTAPARSIVPLTQEQLDKVLTQVDRSTAGKRWKPFKVSDLERYWPSHRPNDPDLFEWSNLDSLDDLHER